MKEQCRLDIKRYLFSQGTINEWEKLFTESVTAIMCSKTKFMNVYKKGGLHINEKSLDSQ